MNGQQLYQAVLAATGDERAASKARASRELADMRRNSEGSR